MLKNMYQGIDLSTPPGKFGHWSNRGNMDGSSYGKLFAGHGHGRYYYNTKNAKTDILPYVYIYRDGRSVAVSIWNSGNFINKKMSLMPFKKYIKTTLDWYGTPSRKDKTRKVNIIQHWLKHVNGWINLRKKNMYFMRYEDLLTSYEYEMIKMFKFFGFDAPKKIVKPNDLVGPGARNIDHINLWKEYFSKKDLKYFFSIVPKNHKCLYNG